jgi:hypothetical protein
MASRFPILAALMAAAPLTGCGEESPPTAPQTVQLALVAGAEHGGASLSRIMTQEVITTPAPWRGDPDGSGLALLTVNVGQQAVCWELSVSAITLPATASHIHKAPPGTAGPAVVFLSPPDAAGRAAGCRSGLSRDLLREILTSPESFYVNVHTSDFAPGAIRGQLGL